MTHIRGNDLHNLQSFTKVLRDEFKSSLPTTEKIENELSERINISVQAGHFACICKFCLIYLTVDGWREIMDAQELKNQVNELIRNQKYDEIEPLLFSHRKKTKSDNDLAVTYYLCAVYKQEKPAGQPVIFSKVSSVEELMERYTVLKFYLRRIDFDVADSLEEFQQFLIEAQVSPYELLKVMDYCVVHKDKVLKAIEGGLPKEAVLGRTSENEGNHRGHKETEEICFIICTNNPVYAQECIHYINHLKVPDGMQTDVLTASRPDRKSVV